MCIGLRFCSILVFVHAFGKKKKKKEKRRKRKKEKKGEYNKNYYMRKCFCVRFDVSECEVVGVSVFIVVW